MQKLGRGKINDKRVACVPPELNINRYLCPLTDFNLIIKCFYSMSYAEGALRSNWATLWSVLTEGWHEQSRLRLGVLVKGHCTTGWTSLGFFGV